MLETLRVSLIESAKLNSSVSSASGSPRDSVFGGLCDLWPTCFAYRICTHLMSTSSFDVEKES